MIPQWKPISSRIWTSWSSFSKQLNMKRVSDVCISCSTLYVLGEGINFSDWIDACKGKIRHAELKEILATVLKERNQ
jgi:hypothetical protein